MKSITNIGIILWAVLISSFNSDHNGFDRVFAKKTRDSSNRFVIFSKDGVTSVDNNRRLDFYYHDSLAYGHPVIIGGKSTNLLLNAPTLLFEASSKQTPFLILPGEKINIKYAGSDSVQLYIQGNTQRSNELNFFRKLVQKTGNIYYGWKIMPYHKRGNTLNSIYDHEKAINHIKDTRLQLLSSFDRQSPVSNNFKKIAINTIKTTALTDSLLLYYNNRELLTQQNLYKKLISEKLISIRNIDFIPFQIYYRTCTTLVSIATTNSTDYNIRDSRDFIKRFDFIDKNFAGITKDFLISNTLYTAYTNAIPVSKEYLHKFNTQCTNVGYKKIIGIKLNEKQGILYSKGGNNLLLVDGKTVQDMQIVISKYKGKITLLDFWASWCSPCREEMPYLDKLKRRYEARKVAFVSISKDTNIDNWLTANKEELLGNNDSFLLLNCDQSMFVKRYNINSIPRYILIGKDGKVINDDAPRPSDPKLKALIDKNL